MKVGGLKLAFDLEFENVSYQECKIAWACKRHSNTKDGMRVLVLFRESYYCDYFHQ